jgi:hypothetical protein
MIQYGGHARAIEEMGMALGGRENAGGLAIGLAAVPVGGTGDQAPGRRGGLHPRQEGREGVRRGRQVFA